MEIYEKKIQLMVEDVSVWGTARPSALLKIFQDISIKHSDEDPPTDDDELLWIIARHHIEIERLPLYKEFVTVRTWCSKPMHVIFPRNYEIEDESGNIIVKGRAEWLVIDPKTRKIALPEDHNINIAYTKTGGELKMPKSEKYPDSESTVPLKALYSLVDINGHINNTSYLNLAEDIMPLEWLKSRSLAAIDIAYKEEILLGAEFDMGYTQRENAWYFKGGEKPAFTLKLTYRE